MHPLDISTLRQALISQALQHAAPTAYPVSPGMRAAPMGALPSGAPNTPGVPAPSMPNPSMPSPVNVGGAGSATSSQQVAKAAQQAQSPLLDPQTRDIAKTLVQKLLQHM